MAVVHVNPPKAPALTNVGSGFYCQSSLSFSFSHVCSCYGWGCSVHAVTHTCTCCHTHTCTRCSTNMYMLLNTCTGCYAHPVQDVQTPVHAVTQTCTCSYTHSVHTVTHTLYRLLHTLCTCYYTHMYTLLHTLCEGCYTHLQCLGLLNVSQAVHARAKHTRGRRGWGGWDLQRRG